MKHGILELVNLKSMATDHDVGYDMNIDNNSPVWVALSCCMVLMVELIKGFFSFSLKKTSQTKSNIYSAAKFLMEKINKVALNEKLQFCKYCMHISKYFFSKLLNVRYMKIKVCHQRYSREPFGAFAA